MNNKEIIRLYNIELKQFLAFAPIQDALKNKDFDYIYETFDKMYSNKTFCSTLTALFLEAKIDFLRYLRIIPSYCFYQLDLDWKGLAIPEGVELIAARAFKSCNIYAIYFPRSLRATGVASFDDCTLTKAIFEDPLWVDLDTNIVCDFSDARYAAEVIKNNSIGFNKVK